MQFIPVMLKHTVIHLYNRVYYTPFLVCDAVSLDVRRQIPRAEAVANPTNLIDKPILPIDAGMGSRSIVQTLNQKGLPRRHMKAQARFGNHIHIFISPNKKNLIPHINRRMRRNPIRKFPQFRYLIRKNIHNQYLPTLHIRIFLLTPTNYDNTFGIYEGIGGISSNMSALELEF